MTQSDAVEHALAAPYTRIFTREADGGYSAWVLELPGVNAAAGRIEEANDDLEAAMADWISYELEAGHEIPPPIEPETYSGRLTFRIPPSLHSRAAIRSQVEGVSLNRLLSDAVSQYLGGTAAAGETTYRSSYQRAAGAHVREEGAASD